MIYHFTQLWSLSILIIQAHNIDTGIQEASDDLVQLHTETVRANFTATIATICEADGLPNSQRLVQEASQPEE